MERYLVLGKLIDIGTKLAKYRADKFSRDDEHREKIDSLPGSGRKILHLLLNQQNSNQRNLAKNMNISSQAVSEAIKKLEHGGFVEKVYGTQNNENIIKLTDEGFIVACKLERNIKEHAEILLKNLSEEEIDTLYNLLSKVLDEDK